jgi:hypothetical protein
MLFAHTEEKLADTVQEVSSLLIVLLLLFFCISLSVSFETVFLSVDKEVLDES